MLQNRYTFHKNISTGLSTTSKGLYGDSRVRYQFFVKRGKSNKLNKEFASHKIFYRQYKKLSDSVISIPKPIRIVESDGDAFFLTDFISKTRGIYSSDISNRSKAYMTVLKFMRDINKNFKKGSSKGLTMKSSAYQLVTLPYYLLKVSVLYPKDIPLFIAASVKIVRYLHQWISLKSDYLCHGDINVGNILLKRDKTILVDFGDTLLSNRYFDMSHALNSSWFQKGFHEYLYRQIINEFKMDMNEQQLLKSFVAYNLMQRLSQHYKSRKQEVFYIKRLQKIISDL